MRLYLLLALPCCLLLSTLPSPSVAQGRILFQEEFEDNARNWPEAESRKLTAQIQAGAYFLKGRSKASANFFGKPVNLTPEQDFRLEIKFTQTKGAKNMGVGFCWGSILKNRRGMVGAYLMFMGSGRLI